MQTSPNTRVALGDWGYMVVLEKAVVRQNQARLGFRGFATGLHVVLTAAHGGLPAGTRDHGRLRRGGRERPQGRSSAPSRRLRRRPRRSRRRRARRASPCPRAPGTSAAADRPEPAPRRRAEAHAAGYVFPVYGQASFGDDFAAARAITGWHHGNDIFAPLGAPILAVADGTLFLVGWNDVGGNRLWLRDGAGNEFYYAHLSAYSPIAREGAQVKAGDVIGFVGATGDAVGTPPTSTSRSTRSSCSGWATTG